MSTIADIRSSVDGLLRGNRTQLLLSVLDNLIWPILIVSFVAFSLLLPRLFTSFSNVNFLLYQSAGLGAIALAESICLISGNFDLSVGSIAGFTAMATALLLTKWAPALPGVVGYPFILLLGALLGLINGFFIAKFGVNPFLQTLSTLIIFEGGILVLSTQSIFGLPSSYTWLGGESIGTPLTPEIPIAVFFMLALFIVMWFVLTKTRFGRSVYAVGGDEDSASEAGIDSDRVIIAVYVISGMLAATGGLLLTGFNASATPTMGTQELFPAFTAAVIGGISLYGGRGNVFNALGGVLLLTTIQAGLVMLAIGPEFIRTINGIVLFLAILLYTGVERLRGRLLSDL
jgi:ribose/xylose/arabinose/galactoside ABC-type transport system permease subunit